ncbi:alpha/beta hydrolase [Falsarthrobacter nasiphocae]|uniref:S-formylglutathione hydrolase FrmB n=1 Tax=Falsarthrobacter nasiphocae TaxID=189863 RepID=A0AAE4C7R4_9MICC|nr:alpha/beta hydrolase-fold protein [Falsarthrobacter nasiphocae]MDR6891685.1 S-formylglutathione hydrolase FrmB [Falsarthrobacter nasiphocae]
MKAWFDSWFTPLDVVDGPVPLTVLCLAGLATLLLVLRRRRRWWVVVLIVTALGGGLTWAAAWLIERYTSLADGPFPAEVFLAAWWAVAAVLLALVALVLGRWWRRILSPVAAALVVLAAAVQINAYYGLYLTGGDITGAGSAAVRPLPEAATRMHARVKEKQKSHGEAPVARTWKEPEGLPTKGLIYSVDIPGKASGFVARTGYVYLPPAYRAKNRPELPVLILLTGQPGNPNQWLGPGNIAKIMDSYASAHKGLAPVVVMPDVTGPDDTENMCMDTRIAKAGTYLSKDIPEWTRSTLAVDANPQRWAIAGFSFGGTCALQMATAHPQQFPSAIVMSGEKEPGIYADRNKTIAEAFGGDAAAFDAQTPLTLLRKNRYPNSAVYFAAGAADATYTGYMNATASAAKAAGMKVEMHSVPGVGHAWKVPNAVLPKALEWLSERLGLVEPRR